jgi:hypothetical protein
MQEDDASTSRRQRKLAGARAVLKMGAQFLLRFLV